ncbi:hypothetical protein L207DRAFT_586577 [Hyaloscypha variabilis F]|uniref:Uncharacterized protein n=1 Tax=Hyaloscypha variabilis (strain UAMH 11265 / GT02V1 / F) TaxID=1149755 RepID=A0A2J6REE5_HYAVF|nr:hypothetical protein L207DRAFT_586577 [Hyaloscypha variabilis F]
MAYDPAVRGQFACSHLLNCPLHDNERTKTCYGYSKKGNACVNKAIEPPVPGTLPMCKVHRTQLKVATLCRARLPCGYECGQPCEWRTHMFQMCPDHLDIPMSCYFLKIPMEMRLRIYGLLLPDARIPARLTGAFPLRASGERCYMEVLRVNRQIHDEATGLLYGTGIFNIEISANGLAMCNRADPSGQTANYYNPGNLYNPRNPGLNLTFPATGHANNGPHGGHALQDYQMQLMLLEQQNKKRLCWARQEQDSIVCSTSNIPPPSPTHPPTQPFIHYPIPCTTTTSTSGPIWTAPLAPRYFNKIHHFHITFLFPSTTQLHTTYPLAPFLASARLYDYSDKIHSLIGRLLQLTHPISTLSLRIKFSDTYATRSSAIYAAQFLLRPFRRLSNIRNPSISAIKMSPYQSGPEIDILSPLPPLPLPLPYPPPSTSAPSIEETNLHAFLRSWKEDLKAEMPVMRRGSRVFDAYWKLEALVKGVRDHYRGCDLGWGRMEELLGVARVAREDGDELGFRVVWENIVGTWLGYLEEQRRWEREVEEQIDGIMGVVWRDEGEESSGNDVFGALGNYEAVENGDWNGEGKGKGKEKCIVID